MKAWDDWTDFEINKSIASIVIGGSNFTEGDEGCVMCYSLSGWCIANPNHCSSWADMGPIISDNGICLTSPTKGRKSSIWSASWNEDGGKWSSGDIVFGDKNPLRAAAIVFLMMNGVNPE